MAKNNKKKTLTRRRTRLLKIVLTDHPEGRLYPQGKKNKKNLEIKTKNYKIYLFLNVRQKWLADIIEAAHN